MSKESTFGAEPERLKRLLTAIGLGESNGDESSDQAAPSTRDGRGLMEQPGTKIGRYKLLRMLGEGGMGIVYLAEQQGSIRRRVALKVIKPGMDSARVLARFDAERQALALLDHPNVAHVYDAGMTEAGRPYFVMEHVKGLPITEHCDHYRLTIEQRLRVFQQVCGAVQHAHQKGIIHRDIKPSNILVTIHEDQAIPKIIDFGVAKAVLQPLTDRTLYTEHGQLFGTPEYMSPEQADMASEDIDTRSDIYSLGVLLYELLTGVLPFDSETLHGGGIDQIRKVICQTDPKTPSTRLTRLGEEAKKVAENRRTEIAALAKCLHRELEWIPLKAMRKERSERYRSASELSDDIENYLTGDPLMAGPPTTRYRLRKSLRRHKALVVGVAAVLAVSVIGTIVSTYFALAQAKVLSRLASELEQKRAVDEFFNVDILEPLANAEMTGTGIREVLDRALENIGTRFADYPLLEGKMRWHFGQIYHWRFNDLDLALPNLERAVELQQQYAAGYSFYRRHYLGLAYRFAGRYQDAEAMFKPIVQSIEEDINKGNKRPDAYYCSAKSFLGSVYRAQGRYDEAERHIRKALEVAPWPKESKPEMLYRRVHARLLVDQGHYREAKEAYEEILRIGGSLQNKDLARGREIIINTLMAKFGYGVLQTIQGNFDEAETLLREALEGIEQRDGPEHRRTIDVKIALAALRTKQEDHGEAESLFDRVLSKMEDRLGDNHPELLRARSHLGVLYREQDRHDEAEELLSEVLQRQARSEELGSDHPHTLQSMHELAVLYMKQDRHQQAVDLLVKVAEGRLDKLGDKHPHTQESVSLLIDLYKTLDQPEEAEKWRSRLPQTEAVGQ